jgi:hypothetical protein
VQAVFGNIRDPFSMLLHSPQLGERMLGLVPFFREDGSAICRLCSTLGLTEVSHR